MRASEILTLARRAGIGPGVSVLDLCCGVAGPGRLVTAALGCDYLGVDLSDSAVAIARARARAAGLACRFQVAEVPPLPPGRHEVVLLLETMLAFPDKRYLLQGISAALQPGGRFAFTAEVGLPLVETERAAMPDADTVWPVPPPELEDLLAGAGLDTQEVTDCTRAHHRVAGALLDAYERHRVDLVPRLGERAVSDLVESHRLWCRWLESGRIRKLAVVARTSGRPVHTR